MKRMYAIALTCGAVPLLVGVAIFLLWLITRWDWLMVAGLITMYAGIVIFFIGAIALAWFLWLAFHVPAPQGRPWFSAICCAVLLLSNFPVAGGIMAAVIAIETRYTVVVENESQQPLDDVRVTGGGCDVNFGTIQAGAVVRRSFWIQQDGQLGFHTVSGATTHDKIIDDYVTGNLGGNTIVTIQSDGTLSVVNKHDL